MDQPFLAFRTVVLVWRGGLVSRGSSRVPFTSGVLKALIVSALLAATPGVAIADLTADLCNDLVGKRPRIIDTFEGRATPVPHCYIHGTLDRDRRFRIQLPATWNGKFVLGMGGGWGGDEFSAASTIGDIVLADGYAYAESNQGRPAPIFDQDDTWAELHYIANQQLARFAEDMIARRYGEKPSYKYLFGSSGGGWRALAQLERYPGFWHGAGIRNPAIEPRNLIFSFSIFDRYFPMAAAQLYVILAARALWQYPSALLNSEEAHSLNRLYDA